MKTVDSQKNEMTELRLNILLLEGYLIDLQEKEVSEETASFMETLKQIISRKQEKLKQIRKDRARKASIRYSQKHRETAKLRSKLWYEKHKKKKKL